jgi:hypothetical protein
MSSTAWWRSGFEVWCADCWINGVTGLIADLRFSLDGANWNAAIFYTAIDVNRSWDEA